MKLGIFLTIMMIASTACRTVRTQDSATLAKEDHKQSVNSDCFTVLLPGSVRDGQLSNVSFANGACQGESRALNKMSTHSQVAVYRDGERFVSSIYAQGKDLMVQLGSERVKLATYPDSNEVSALSLVPGAIVSLTVKGSNGLVSKWQHGDDSRQSQEEIRIQLR